MEGRSAAPALPGDPRDVPVYRLAEAARYVRVPVSTLRGWLAGWDYRTRRGTRRAVPLIRPPHGEVPGRLLSFYNLVESHILAQLRRQHGIPMLTVRKAIRRAEGKAGARHPLFHARLAAEGADLVIDRGGKQEDQDGQCVFFFASERPLGRIDWEPRSGLPLRIYPWVSGEDARGPRRIVIDPERAAGRPLIAGAEIPTAVVAARHREGASVIELAGEYGLDPACIEDALRCEG